MGSQPRETGPCRTLVAEAGQRGWQEAMGPRSQALRPMPTVARTAFTYKLTCQEEP